MTSLQILPQVAAATSQDKVQSKLKQIITTSGYIPGTSTNCTCKVFVDSLSNKIFGTTTGKQVTTPYVLSSSTYTCLGSLNGANATKENLISLLKAASPGDVIQYKSHYTTSSHTAMIYSLDESKLTIINSRTVNGSYRIMLDSMNWNSITSTWPGIGSISGNSARGLSLYHHNDYQKLYPADAPVILAVKPVAVKKYPSKTIGVGESLSLSSEKADEVVWTSTDTAVTVDENGKIIGNKAGSAIVTAKAQNGDFESYEIIVKPAIGSIKLNKSTITVGVGEQFDFDSTANSGGASYSRVYTSSNKSVATVKASGGLMTAKSVGTTNITVTCYNGVKATCKVTVKPAISSINLNKTSITVGVGEKFDFDSTANSGGASYSRIYTSDNQSVASVKASGGLMTAKSVGVANITVTCFNGVKATCKVTVKK